MIFSKEITPVCAYCEFGQQIIGTDDVLCKKKGVVKAGDCCRKFRYTPLKRTPPPQTVFDSPFEAEDFKF